MADALTSVASAAIDYQQSPPIDPPATTFPYPEQDKSQSTTPGVDTDGTETETEIDTQDAHTTLKTFDRPELVRKFDTEIPAPVGERHLPPLIKHRSNITDPEGAPKADLILDTTSDTSEEEDPDQFQHKPHLARSLTQPERNPLSKAQLNRVHTNPRERGLTVGNEFFSSSGRVARDGRLNISVNETANSGYLAKALGATLERHLKPHFKQEVEAARQAKDDFAQAKSTLQVPSLNIVIMVIGSRGDIQPFLKIGKILRDKYHHRVRIATHPTFKKFVEEDIGLEFFSVGGDPSELMAFMVKNPGLIPSLETLKAGEIGRRREAMYQMFQGFWRACTNATDDETDVANLKMMGAKSPFVADAIIANPPSFAHYHCAERLSIPLHLIFTFPYSPTQAFPHPLANIKSSNVDQSYSNFMSYPLVDLMTWQGLGDLVNKFRIQTLGLEPLSTLWAPGQLSRLKIPVTYLWSPGLVPKPNDWGPEIDIVGYVFLDLASSYKPPQDLLEFLDSPDDRPLVYIGFGSIAGIDDPRAFTKIIFEGVAKANVRAIISRGWGGMGDGMEKPDGVFMIDNVPHDWLFPKVDAVVHHGGAGTTAAGLRYGKPTLIVPFFGDQPFWSAMIVKAGAGAKEALPLKMLNSDKFADGIRQCLEPEAKKNAQAIAKSIEAEGDGAENAVDSFHRALNLDSMRCDVFKNRVAVWNVRHTRTQLSALAADILVENKVLQWSDLHLRKVREWTDFQGPGEPITGTGGVVINAFQEAFHSLSDMHETTKKDLKSYGKRRRRRHGRTVADGIVLPGRIAYATQGTSVEEQRKEHDRLRREVNLHGKAEPPKAIFAPSSARDDESNQMSELGRTSTNGSEARPVLVSIAKDVGKGLGTSSRVIAQLPFRMWTAAALGFHNAPRLYGDKTVRPAPGRINGLRSGVKAAGTEFYYGIYDGVTGIVRLPYLEVQEEGLSGLPKGVARGVGGFVLKPISGVLGLGAYSFKGAYQSVRRRVLDTEKTDRWIRRARIAQGQREIQQLKSKGRIPKHNAESGGMEQLETIRDHALRQWTTYEQDQVSNARERERSKTTWKTQKDEANNIKKSTRAKTH